MPAHYPPTNHAAAPLDLGAVSLLKSLDQAAETDFAELVEAAALPPGGDSGTSAPVARLAEPPRETALPERRESATRLFQKGLWEAAAVDLQKLLDAGEAPAEYTPKLITCLLNAHDELLSTDAARIEALLRQLETTGRSALAAPLRSVSGSRPNAVLSENLGGRSGEGLIRLAGRWSCCWPMDTH